MLLSLFKIAPEILLIRPTGKDDNQTTRPVMVQSIPVGQSIDSADYEIFEQSKENNNNKQAHDEHNETRITNKRVDDDQQAKPQVEEAVIKIQALVRGHLTRKALKDAQQHSATPPPNALGQSQFDEESLTRNRK